MDLKEIFLETNSSPQTGDLTNFRRKENYENFDKNFENFEVTRTIISTSESLEQF